MSWAHFQEHYHHYPVLGISLDLSRLPLPAAFTAAMERPMQEAFAAMRALEGGAIANPDEGRRVGHYWLRTPALAPTPEIRAEIEDTLRALRAFAADVHAGTIAGPRGRFRELLVIGIGGSALGPQLVANALGQPRSWVDHLLWHHACHTVDLFAYQTGEKISEAYAVQGPYHPELKIAMDMGVVMKTPSGAVCVLSLSFNDDGPIGSPYRYMCDKGTWVSFYDDLTDGHGKKIDLAGVAPSMNGFENQDREFIAAIQEKRAPNCSVADALSTMQTLGMLEDMLIKANGHPK